MNNYIGANNTSQTRYDFDWYNPHLYRGTTGIIKAVLLIVFEASEIFCLAAVGIYISIHKKNRLFFPLHYQKFIHISIFAVSFLVSKNRISHNLLRLRNQNIIYHRQCHEKIYSIVKVLETLKVAKILKLTSNFVYANENFFLIVGC